MTVSIPEEDEIPLNDVDGDGVSKVLSLVHSNDDLLSVFSDEDALLSLAPNAIEVSSYGGSQRSDRHTGTIDISDQSIKSSELREQTSKIRFDGDVSSKHFAIKLDFDSIGLVGRQNQISTLISCFDRLCKDKASNSPNDDRNQKEMVFVSGESGCGKTRTVKTLESRMLETKTGLFVEGKFDLNTVDEPYSGIAKAIAAICEKILNGDKSHAKDIRDKISNALHDEEVQLLVHLVPALSDIISADAIGATVGVDIDDLESGIERLKRTFRLLLRTFCEHFAPMVLFLDDLQWADVSSIQMIDYLISDTENENSLMIIGSYRSDEVDENSLLHNKILALRDKSVTYNFHVTEVDIPLFDIDDIMTTIKSVFLSVKEDDSRALGGLCLKRTLGNPYFVLEFLKTLYHEGLVSYNTVTNMWTWNLTNIEDAAMSTANVVVLLQDRMKRLSKYAQMFLRCAAYLGSTFRNTTLELIWKSHNMPMTVADKPVLPLLMGMAVKDSFIEECGSDKYRWVHDKVQEAAFSLILDVKVSQFDIGRILFYYLEPSQLEQDLFAVVDLINNGNKEKSSEFAHANLQAAEKALGLSAFSAAAKYATHGIDQLNDNRWSQNRPMTLRLYTIGAEMERLLGNVTAAERYRCEVLSRTDLDIMESLPLKLATASNLSSVELKFDEAVAYCLDVLKELGCRVFISRKILKAQAVMSLFRTIRRVKKLPSDHFDHAKMMENERQLGIAKLITRAGVSAYLSGDIMISVICACKLVEGSLQHGLNEASASSLSGLATMTIIVLQDFKTATKFNEMALSLLKKHRQMHNGETLLNAYTHGHVWVKPVDSCLPAIWDGYRCSIRSGDSEFASWNLSLHQILLPFYFGKPLPQILARCPSVMRQFEDGAQSQQILIHKVIWQTMANLHDSSCREPWKLEGEIFHENDDIEKDNIHAGTVLLAQGELLLFHGDCRTAADMALENGDAYQKLVPANFANMFEAFHRALASYAMALRTRKKKYKKEAKRVRRMLTKWVLAIENPEFNYFKTVLDAEQFAVEKKHDKAEKHYDEAIKSATIRGHLHYTALFHERYSEYLLVELSNLGKSNEELRKAIDCYKAWGADGKVKALESKLALRDGQ
ncbi:unnamed protein product [Cylindrotheca closterium]|uniref:Orc1-like AAA ATPase domain-containing protein n=1 Tax=Cylindrotheca closterium TaxID=2856 RepID=A0AAD2FLJ0_9STRA|nr:unnamed protein product [Cylindrotheca closterium]